MTPEQATTLPRTRSAECAECGRAFEPARDWARFCGDACRAAHWRRTAEEKENPPTVAAETAGEMAEQKQHSAQHRNRPVARQQIRSTTKLFAVLAALARGQRLNRFEAWRDLHDSVLNSTIAEIESRGVMVARREETVAGFRGAKVRCSRYWLEPEEREKAAVLLGWRPCQLKT